MKKKKALHGTQLILGLSGGALLAGLAAPGAGFAEAVRLEPVTVTASRHEQKVEDVSPATEIITREDIEAVGADTLEDILKYATSTFMYRDMLRSTPSVRGFEGKHTLILIDGKRYAGAEGKFDDPTRFTTANIERIEVVRGPMSSLYGSEAMGGVINIITKKASKNEVTAGIKHGSYSHGDQASNASFTLQLADPQQVGLLGKLSLSLAAQQLWQDNLLAGDGTSILPEDDTGSFTGTLGLALSEKMRLELDGGYHKSDLEHILITSNQLSTSSNDYTSHDLGAAMHYESPELNGMLRAYLSHYEKDYEKRFNQGSQAGQITTSKTDFDDGVRDTRIVEGKFDRLFVTPMGKQRLTLGGELRQEEHQSIRINGTGSTACGQGTRDGVSQRLGCYDPASKAVYLQDEWDIGERISLVPSVRYDEHENYDSEWSPKAGVVFRFNDSLRAKANYGHAFRAPGAGELFQDYYGMGGRYHIIGNTELEPETSNSFDLAMEGSGRGWFGRVGYFSSAVDNLIDTVSRSSKQGVLTYQYDNVDKASLDGVELELAWQALADLRLGLNYTYLQAEDDTTGERLAGKPRNLAVLKADYRYSPWDLAASLRLRYLGDYGYTTSTSQFRNDSEFITSIKLTKGLNKHLDLFVGVDDLFDNHAAYYGVTANDGVLERPGAFYYTGITMRY